MRLMKTNFRRAIVLVPIGTQRRSSNPLNDALAAVRRSVFGRGWDDDGVNDGHVSRLDHPAEATT